jgi:hypothetical protein
MCAVQPALAATPWHSGHHAVFAPDAAPAACTEEMSRSKSDTWLKRHSMSTVGLNNDQQQLQIYCSLYMATRSSIVLRYCIDATTMKHRNIFTCCYGVSGLGFFSQLVVESQTCYSSWEVSISGWVCRRAPQTLCLSYTLHAFLADARCMRMDQGHLSGADRSRHGHAAPGGALSGVWLRLCPSYSQQQEGCHPSPSAGMWRGRSHSIAI